MITHEQLHEQTLIAAKNEKSATLVLLNKLKQIDERRTYAVMGYSSLFKYVEEALGYSPSQTSERVSAARLLRKVPEVASQLSEGTHNLSTLSRVASHVQREGLNPEEAASLVLETANLSVVKVEKHLLGVAQMEPERQERSKVISKELTRLSLDVDDAFMAEVTRVRELHGNPAMSLSEVFSLAMKELIAKKEIKKPKEVAPVLRTSEVADYSRYIPVNDKRIVHERAEGQCEYVHEKTGKKCSSKVGLQFEHILPFAKGGGSSEKNLKLYCPTHNRLSAIHQFGKAKMQQYLRL